MPTQKEINSSKLGIIAGSGDLPARLAEICAKKNITPYIIGFEGQTSVNLMSENNHLWVNIGSAGKIIDFFKSNGVTELVLIGAIKRPAFKDIKPDFKGVKILSKIGVKSLGDNDLLVILRKELELESFNLRAMHEFCDQLLVGEGDIGKYSPKIEDKDTIKLGLEISQKIGALDIGQSVIVQNGIVIGVEAAEGTDNLIKRCAKLQQNGGGAILVKTCKPQQDRSLDMPTIGVDTIINAHKSGLCGIALHAGNVMVVDAKNIAKYADKYKMFVTGFPIKQK